MRAKIATSLLTPAKDATYGVGENRTQPSQGKKRPSRQLTQPTHNKIPKKKLQARKNRSRKSHQKIGLNRTIKRKSRKNPQQIPRIRRKRRQSLKATQKRRKIAKQATQKRQKNQPLQKNPTASNPQTTNPKIKSNHLRVRQLARVKMPKTSNRSQLKGTNKCLSHHQTSRQCFLKAKSSF